MGKSATTKLFLASGVPVWDADATVHELYHGDTPAVHGIEKMVPEAVINQQVDRGILKKFIAKCPQLLKDIEALVHPLISRSRQEFVSKSTAANANLIIIDHPLLFETKSEIICDAVLVVTTTAQEQKRRVMARPGMTEETFQFILSKQIPDAEKRQRADYILETTTPEAAQEFVQRLIAKINGKIPDA